MQDQIVRMNGKEFLAEYDNQEQSNVRINDVTYHIELLKQISPKVYSFVINQKLMIADFELDDTSNKLVITVDGFSFDINITNETRRLVEQYINQAGHHSSDGAFLVKAPMPGMVVKINVEPGQLVRKGDKVIIVEAMKMENALAVQIGGIIKSIRVKEGQPVDKDAILIELEDANASEVG